MIERIIETNLKKKALDALLEKVKQRSDCFSIARYYHGYMSRDEFEQMQQAFYEMIMTEHQRRLSDYQYNINGYQDELKRLFHFENEQMAQDYFEELHRQEMALYDEYQYCEFSCLTKEQLDLPENLLIKKEYTRITPVTIGPVFEVLTLSMEAFELITVQMKKLFSTYRLFHYEFEDLCCYSGKDVIFKICSHEKFAVLYENESSNDC